MGFTAPCMVLYLYDSLVVILCSKFHCISIADFFVVYIIVGSLAFVAVAGGLIWGLFVFAKRYAAFNYI